MEATSEEVDQAVEKEEEGFRIYRQKSGEDRAEFLEAIADEIMALSDELIERGSSESGLSEGRLTGESGRTVGQLRLFADVVREDSWVDARINKSESAPDIKSMKMALGSVAILGPVTFFGLFCCGRRYSFCSDIWMYHRR